MKHEEQDLYGQGIAWLKKHPDCILDAWAIDGTSLGIPMCAGYTESVEA